MEHRPQQLDSHSASFSQVPPLVDPIDCICGMTLPPNSPPPASVSADSSVSLEEFPQTSTEVFTIQCDECGRWLHGSCVGIAPDDVIPDTFSCPKCVQERKALLQQHQQAIYKQQLAGKLRKSITKASPIQTTGVDDHPYVDHNTVASDAASALKLLQVDYDRLEDLLPQPLSGSYANVNFEFAGDIIPFPDDHPLSELDKYIEVKEIRSRGQVLNRKGVKRGIFSLQYIDIGQSICEFCGHVVRLEALFAKIHKITTVPQSFVLFPPSKADVVVDARRHGSQARWVRRSCRPNTIVKSILHKGAVLWYLFAKQTIKPGDELFLPLDWETGNRFFRYECACNSPETCLAPDELLPEGYRENLIQKEDLPTVAGVDLISAPVSAHSDRKLSREEKKLQRYIEAFEKMENSERKKPRVTPPSSSPETSRKQSIKQQPTKSTSATQSKKKTVSEFIPSALPLKKIWAAKQSEKVKQDTAEPQLYSSLSSEITSATTEEEPAEEIHAESVVVGPREETPVSQLISDEATSSSAKRLSLSDFLHRKMSQIRNPLPHEEKRLQPEMVAEEGEGDSKGELSSTSSSRESGEYIEAPSFSPIKYQQHASPPRDYRGRSQSPPEAMIIPRTRSSLPLSIPIMITTVNITIELRHCPFSMLLPTCIIQINNITITGNRNIMIMMIQAAIISNRFIIPIINSIIVISLYSSRLKTYHSTMVIMIRVIKRRGIRHHNLQITTVTPTGLRITTNLTELIPLLRYSSIYHINSIRSKFISFREGGRHHCFVPDTIDLHHRGINLRFLKKISVIFIRLPLPPVQITFVSKCHFHFVQFFYLIIYFQME